jgi:ABC-type sugar transport system permease subunit
MWKCVLIIYLLSNFVYVLIPIEDSFTSLILQRQIVIPSTQYKQILKMQAELIRIFIVTEIWSLLAVLFSL